MEEYPETLTNPLCHYRGYITHCSFCYKLFHFLNKNLVYTSYPKNKNHSSIDYIDIMCPHCGQVQGTSIPHRTKVFRDETEFWPTDLEERKVKKLESFKVKCPYCEQENIYRKKI